MPNFFYAFMVFRPVAPEILPSMEYKGLNVIVINHHGFSKPYKGAVPKNKIIYGVRDEKGERHWRSSYEEIVQLIDRNFVPSPLSSHE
jgi:hypothetical protein